MKDYTKYRRTFASFDFITKESLDIDIDINNTVIIKISKDARTIKTLVLTDNEEDENNKFIYESIVEYINKTVDYRDGDCFIRDLDIAHDVFEEALVKIGFGKIDN